MQGKEQKILLVWVTNPEAAGRIADTGRRLADETGSELRIVSIQNPIHNETWENTLSDLEQLHHAARSVQADLTVVYSDNRFEAAVKLIREIAPSAMVAGVSGDLSRNLFLEHIRTYNREVPIYIVDSAGNTLKLTE